MIQSVYKILHIIIICRDHGEIMNASCPNVELVNTSHGQNTQRLLETLILGSQQNLGIFYLCSCRRFLQLLYNRSAQKSSCLYTFNVIYMPMLQSIARKL